MGLKGLKTAVNIYDFHLLVHHFTGLLRTSIMTSSVEHCTGIAVVMGSNPIINQNYDKEEKQTVTCMDTSILIKITTKLLNMIGYHQPNLSTNRTVYA